MMASWVLMALAAQAPAGVQVPVLAPPVITSVPSDLSKSPLAPGSWAYGPTSTGSRARFVDATGTARLVLQCDRATRRVMISHTSTAPSPMLHVWTSSASRTLPARFEPNVFRVTAELFAHDRLLDAIAFSRGRIGVTMAGYAPLVVPAWPEAARAIEDCRS
jgi:hypothetical protein